jgi:hypothetical protein
MDPPRKGNLPNEQMVARLASLLTFCAVEYGV